MVNETIKSLTRTGYNTSGQQSRVYQSDRGVNVPFEEFALPRIRPTSKAKLTKHDTIAVRRLLGPWKPPTAAPVRQKLKPKSSTREARYYNRQRAAELGAHEQQQAGPAASKRAEAKEDEPAIRLRTGTIVAVPKNIDGVSPQRRAHDARLWCLGRAMEDVLGTHAHGLVQLYDEDAGGGRFSPGRDIIVADMEFVVIFSGVRAGDDDVVDVTDEQWEGVLVDVLRDLRGGVNEEEDGIDEVGTDDEDGLDGKDGADA